MDNKENDAPKESIASLIGSTLRKLRRRRGWSSYDLAEHSGVSVSMLSRIENGHTSPSLATLDALSQALDVPLANFFIDNRKESDTTFVKAGKGLSVDRHSGRHGHLYQLLGHASHQDLSLEPYFITLSKKSEEFPLLAHEGIEFIYVIEGEMRYRTGEQIFHMTAGDSLYFDGSVTHGPEELVEVPVKIITVIGSLRH